jgi:hypothetical protein
MPNRTNALLLALVIALAVTVVAMAIHLPPPITEEQFAAAQAPAQKHVCQFSPLRCFWNWTTHDPVAFFTFVLAVFTAILSGSTVALWFATRRAAERAEMAVRTVEGAWIFAAPLLQPNVLAAEPRMQMYVSNHGNTPGLIIQYHMEFSNTVPTGDVASYRRPIDETKTVEIMGPREKNWPLQYEFDWNGVDTFALGYVTYRDAFGKTKTSRFCYDISTGRTIIAGSPAYNSFHPEGN